jgi:hypothetical protein
MTMKESAVTKPVARLIEHMPRIGMLSPVSVFGSILSTTICNLSRAAKPTKRGDHNMTRA